MKGGKGKDSSLRQQVKIWAGQYCWPAPGNICWSALGNIDLELNTVMC